MSPGIRATLELQRKLLRAKFPCDPAMAASNDTAANDNQPLLRGSRTSAEVIAAIAYDVGVPAEKVYAIQKTGMILVAGYNDDWFSDEEKAEWQAAIDEFHAIE